MSHLSDREIVGCQRVSRPNQKNEEDSLSWTGSHLYLSGFATHMLDSLVFKKKCPKQTMSILWSAASQSKANIFLFARNEYTRFLCFYPNLCCWHRFREFSSFFESAETFLEWSINLYMISLKGVSGQDLEKAFAEVHKACQTKTKVSDGAYFDKRPNSVKNKCCFTRSNRRHFEGTLARPRAKGDIRLIDRWIRNIWTLHSDQPQWSAGENCTPRFRWFLSMWTVCRSVAAGIVARVARLDCEDYREIRCAFTRSRVHANFTIVSSNPHSRPGRLWLSSFSSENIPFFSRCSAMLNAQWSSWEWWVTYKLFNARCFRIQEWNLTVS